MLDEVIPDTLPDPGPSIATVIRKDRGRRRTVRTLGLAAALATIVAGAWVLRERIPPVPTEATRTPFDSHAPTADRLRAVLSLDVTNAAGSDLAQLLDVLDHDPNEHVRLAALDAMTGSILGGRVRTARLLTILRHEESPLVQSDLVDVLRRVGGDAIVPQLRGALSPETTHPFVQDQLSAKL
jgi:hypothetical protein